MRIAPVFVFAAATIATVVASDAYDWYKSALIYQIYPRSFKDSNGDGIGDLNGISQKLSYLKKTGVDAVWLSPIFLSPMYDFGYDIADYRQIAPEYGTLRDFDDLMKEAKKLGVRIILDFVPNHTSNESDWFVKSAQRVPGYEDYYIWADGKPDPNKEGAFLPPNNWVSVFRKSAWEYNKNRKQFYLHQFVIGQPDLNYREIKVHNEMENVLRFWLDRGVSGFRVDAINMMYEVDAELYGGQYPDEPVSGKPNMTSNDYDYLNHIYTKDQNETYNVVYNWRDLLDEYTPKHGEYKIMMTESYTDLDRIMRYYGNKRNGSIPFNFIFLESITNSSNARDIVSIINTWMTAMPAGKVANWVNGNHDQSRLASRHGTDRVDAMNMLALLLPGIAVTYQGEEIGMTDGYVSWEDTKDPQALNTDDPVNYWKKSRDPERTPYHWDATANAGFSTTTGKTWLPVADNYKTLNLAAQIDEKKSHYTFYKDMATVKKTPAVRRGKLHMKAMSDNLLVVARILSDSSSIIGVVNLSKDNENVDLTYIEQSKAEVVASGVDCTLEKGTIVNTEDVQISPHCAIVLKTTYDINNYPVEFI